MKITSAVIEDSILTFIYDRGQRATIKLNPDNVTDIYHIVITKEALADIVNALNEGLAK